LLGEEAMAVETFESNLAELRESTKDHESAKTERIGSPSLGDVVRQGDLYLVCLDKLPGGTATQERQLAPGNTQGSRHILSGNCEIVKDVIFNNMGAVLVGPAFKCKGDVEVTHPEHGNKILPDGTVWQVTYQLAHSDELKRVQD
jgi:hypothetical protein